MEARERLAIRLGHADGYELRDIRSTVGPEKDASLWRKYLGLADAAIAAFHLTDAAALALMDGEGVVVPKEWNGKVLSTVAKFVRDRAIPSPADDDPYAVYFDNGHARELCRAMLAASPYKENPDDPR